MITMKKLYINTISIALIILSIATYTISNTHKNNYEKTSEKIEVLKIKLADHINNKESLAKIIKILDTTDAASYAEVELMEFYSVLFLASGLLNMLIVTPLIKKNV